MVAHYLHESQYKTLSDIEQECLMHMTSNKLPFSGRSLVFNTKKPERYSADQNLKKRDEWYIGTAGVSIKGRPFLYVTYGSFSTSEKFTFTSWKEGDVIDQKELDELRKLAKSSKELAERIIREEHEKIAVDCQKIWKECRSNTPNENHLKYLKLKNVKAHGVGYGKNPQGFDSIVIPLLNNQGQIRTLQYISVGIDGKVYKNFYKDGEKKGNYFILGTINTKSSIFIGEGYSTCASPFEALGQPVVVAFDCKNLSPVIENLRQRYPENKIIILADDDKESKNSKGELINPGKSAAEGISRKFGIDYILPQFPEAFRLPNGDRPTDFNDLHVYFGLEEVKKQLLNYSQENNWPDPKPIIAESFPVLPFDFEKLLPPSLREFVQDESDRMPCPPDFIAASLMVILGSIIGARCAIKPKKNDSWIIVPNLWGGIVGIPSSKKSPAINAAMKPLERLITFAMNKFEQANNDYENEKIVYEAKTDAIVSRLKVAAKDVNGKSDPDSIAKELQRHKQNIPITPKLRRYKSNDTTVEKLGELLRDNPAGLLILRDELVGLLAVWEKSGHEGERSFYLESWNGCSSFDTDRIGRGTIFIPNLSTSLLGGIQPDKLTGYLEQSANSLANDGMLQRFQVLVYPDHRNWEWCDHPPNRQARNNMFEIFDDLAIFDPIIRGAEPSNEFIKFPYFQFDDESQQFFKEWSHDLNLEILPKEDNPLISQHLTKYNKLFPALALIFHLVDCAVTKKSGSIKIQSTLLAAAWCEYLESHARRCYGLLADDGLKAAQAISKKIIETKKLCNDFTIRDVRRNQWRYLTTDQAIKAALEWLEDDGWIRSYEVGGTGPGSGRPTIRYKVNPKILKSFTHNKQDNKASYEDH